MPTITYTPVFSQTLPNKLGVNTHLRYTDTPYHHNFSEVKSLLQELGIKRVRDKYEFVATSALTAYDRQRELHQELGIRYCAILDYRKPNGAPGYDALEVQLDRLSEEDPFKFDYIEGLNEFDATDRTCWACESNLYDRIIQTLVIDVPKLNPSLKQPSKASEYPHATDNHLTSIHPYADFPYFRPPGTALSYNFFHYGAARPNTNYVATEFGYKSAPEWMSDHTIAKYMARFPLHFDAHPNIQSFYIYNLLDLKQDLDQWGLVQTTGNQPPFALTKKPAFHVIKSLMNVFGDSGVVPPLLPVDVDVTKEENVWTRLYRKSDKTYLLAIWRNTTEDYNPTDKNFESPASPFTITVPNWARIMGVWYCSLSDYTYKLSSKPNLQSISESLYGFPKIIEFSSIA